MDYSLETPNYIKPLLIEKTDFLTVQLYDAGFEEFICYRIEIKKGNCYNLNLNTTTIMICLQG